MTDSQRKRRLDKAQMRVLFHTPFFAPGVMRLPVEFTDDSAVPTACTDGQRILWNRAHFDGLEDPVIVTVLAHEVAHCMLGHLWRMEDRDCSVWNEAADHAVNTMLEEFGQLVKAQGLADPFPMPDGCLHDAQFKGMAEEAIYARLSQRPKSGPGKQPQPQGASGPSGGHSGASGPGKSNGGPGNASNQPSTGQRKPFGEFSKPVSDASVQKRDKSDWEGALCQAASLARKQGTLPGSLARYVKELVSPKVPWTELLRSFLREQAAEDWDFMRPNRFYDESPFILPSLHSERMGAIVFAVDTSGSIDTEMLRKFKSEMQSCLDDLKPSRLLEYCCDTRITAEREYVQGDKVDGTAPGGGGTSFVPVFDRLDALTVPPKCLVYLTDLAGAFPSVGPEYPVLWVTYSAPGQKAPFGQTVEVE